jgi:hypothetical protein
LRPKRSAIGVFEFYAYNLIAFAFLLKLIRRLARQRLVSFFEHCLIDVSLAIKTFLIA